MSRRKQSKPQHVEFADDKNVVPTSKPNTDATGGVKPFLLPVNAPIHECATEQTQFAANSVEFIDTNEERSSSDHTLTKLEEKTKASETTGLIHSPDAESLMASITNDVKNEHLEQEKEPAEFGDPRHGQHTPSHRSLLQPKYASRTCDNVQSECKEDMDRSVARVDENNATHGEIDATENEISDKSELGSVERDQKGFDKEESGEMHTCERCDAVFDVFEDFVQHEKFECENSSEKESYEAQSNYVISGNLIMANEDNLAAEISSRSNGSNTHNHNQDIMEQDDSVDSSGVKLESLSGTLVAMSQTMPEHQENGNSEISSRKDEFMDHTGSVSPDHTEEKVPGHNEMSDQEEANDDHNNRSLTPKKDEGCDSEKLRKEIMATEAMAQAIQNMTEFASQATGAEDDKEKPDISAIKYQVRMIQQQQAYQVQMLNFLQWQLALASSNSQGAMAAANAANNRNAIANGFGMNQPLQPPMLLGGGGLGGHSLMPQMMAMAMNNFQGNANEGNNLTELAKARLMMSMPPQMTENEQKFCNIYAGSQEEMTERRDQEQRYQLKETNEQEENRQRKNSDEISDQNEKPISINSPTGPRQPKSDSGYDDDARSGSHGNGTTADDASSSHGSQEDGELRDGVLKATAEEHRHRCRYCHKVFGSDSALQIHIRSHTGERPFKCNICGNRFTTKGNLKVHFTRHKSKYPHIPMNNQPVPEYLDNVPTSNGVPYGMSILPEKAVLERPRLHGNPSIHINPQQSTGMTQREPQPSHGAPGFFMPHLNVGGTKPENESLFQSERPEVGLGNGMAPADIASAIQAQLLQRRRAEYLESQWTGESVQKSPNLNDIPEMTDGKNPMSMLHAAMLPFLPGIVARQQMEAIPPHLRYLQHLHAMQAQNAANSMPDKNNNNAPMRFPTLPRSVSPPSDQLFSEKARSLSTIAEMHKMASRRPQLPVPTPSSETSKLQRLVENIDKGRTLQKNECHMCHRILSCQSALKLHYRTHTGERPYKCDLCSRAFTTRGNLRTHYSSVHRQQMRPLPPGGQGSRSSQENFSCSLCPARFREAVEFQHHMQMHAMVQARQQQERYLAMEKENSRTESPSPVDLTSRLEESKPVSTETNSEIKSENKDIVYNQEADEEFNRQAKDNDQENSSVSRTSSLSEDPENIDEGMDSPFVMPVKNEPSNSRNVSREEERRISSPAKMTSTPPANPLDSLAALSNLTSGNDFPQHTGSMLDHQLAALSRARAGRLTVCEICEKPFSCQSALEIHLRTHTKERPFMCKICQRAFTTKGNLKQHLLTHNITDIPDQMLMPVSSPTEGNSASSTPSTSPTPSETQKYGQKRPADMIEDGLDPAAKRAFPRHWCHICQKQFSSASSLQIHNRTHTGEKPFACNVCGRAFTTKGNLKVHMGTHVWGAGGSRRGRRISMDNPLISPWMKNMTRSLPTQSGMVPATGHVSDPAALYQQYAAIANGLLTAKQEAASRFMLPVTNGQTVNSVNSASSPVSSSGSPLPSNEMTSPQNRVSGTMPSTAMNAATEWFLKAYQRTQEQVN